MKYENRKLSFTDKLLFSILSPEWLNEWRLEQRRVLREIIGLVLMDFAVFVLFEVLG